MFRHAILFPLRLIGLLSCFAVFFAMFFSVKAFMPKSRTKLAVEQRLIRFMCGEWKRRGNDMQIQLQPPHAAATC